MNEMTNKKYNNLFVKLKVAIHKPIKNGYEQLYQEL